MKLKKLKMCFPVWNAQLLKFATFAHISFGQVQVGPHVMLPRLSDSQILQIALQLGRLCRACMCVGGCKAVCVCVAHQPYACVRHAPLIKKQLQIWRHLPGCHELHICGARKSFPSAKLKVCVAHVKVYLHCWPGGVGVGRWRDMIFFFFSFALAHLCAMVF